MSSLRLLIIKIQNYIGHHFTHLICHYHIFITIISTNIIITIIIIITPSET